MSAVSNWPSLYRRCFEHLEKGGWLEIPDVVIGTFSDSFDWRDESSPLMRWYQCYRRGASSRGIDGFAGDKRTEDLAAQSFTRITEKRFKCYLDEDAVSTELDKQVA